MKILILDENELTEAGKKIRYIDNIQINHIKTPLQILSVADRIIIAYENQFKIIKERNHVELYNLVISAQEIMAYI